MSRSVEATVPPADGLEQLYRECHPRLSRMLRQRLSTPEEADDVAHDAFVNLMVRPGAAEADPIEVAPRYLFRAAVNIAIDRLRRERRWRERERADPADLDMPCPAPCPERTLLARGDMRQVQELLNQLPPPCRHAFLRRRVEAHSVADIARDMGISESMVRKHVLRARRHCLSARTG